jgi:hypothetical protein
LAASRYRADKNAMASTTSHPTMTKDVTAPAVILAFSFVVYSRIERLNWRPLSFEFFDFQKKRPQFGETEAAIFIGCRAAHLPSGSGHPAIPATLVPIGQHFPGFLDLARLCSIDSYRGIAVVMNGF